MPVQCLLNQGYIWPYRLTCLSSVFQSILKINESSRLLSQEFHALSLGKKSQSRARGQRAYKTTTRKLLSHSMGVTEGNSDGLRAKTQQHTWIDSPRFCCSLKHLKIQERSGSSLPHLSSRWPRNESSLEFKEERTWRQLSVERVSLRIPIVKMFTQNTWRWWWENRGFYALNPFSWP